jgi:hypothetical protein
VFNNILLMGSSGGGTSNLEIIVSSNTVGFNALTAAQGLGFDNSLTDDRIITVTINSGVTLSGSSGAFQSGPIQQNTTLEVINNGTITGANGPVGSGGSNGSVGRIGIIYSTVVGGTATHSFINNGTINGGGGGGGSGGRAETAIPDGDGSINCGAPINIGQAGDAGSFGATGGTGSYSTDSSSQDISWCGVGDSGYAPGAGGAGGASINWQSRTVSFTNNGTVNGTIVS